MRQKTHKDVVIGWTPFTDAAIARYVKKGYWHNLTTGDVLDRTAAQFPDKISVIDDKTRLTWKQLKDRSDRLALHLIRSGVSYGDFIVLLMPNIVELLYIYFALNRIGAIPVMSLPRHRHLEVEHVIGLHEARGICVSFDESFDYVGLVEGLKGKYPHLNLLWGAGESRAPDGWMSINQMLEEDISDEFEDDVLSRLAPDPNDICTEQLSGGTTGVPKGIPRTHNDYISQWHYYAYSIGMNNDAVFVLVPPLAHNAGWLHFAASLVHGATFVMTKEPKMENFLRLVEKYQATHSFLIPVQISYLMETKDILEKYDLSSLRVVIGAAQKVKLEQLNWLIDKLKVHPVHSFGMAEGPLILNSWLTTADVQLNTIGKPAYNDPEDYSFKLVDLDGKEVGQGQIGEMISKGAGTFKGYFRNPQENAKVFDENGYFWSGDLMSMRADGRYIVEGRSKDMIIRGGENVYPEGVEQLLMEHSAVLTAVCVGMPDPSLGERLCAFVQLKEGAVFSDEEMRTYMKSRGVAAYQWPERIEVVTGWPLTAVQKINKLLLRGYITAQLYKEGRIDKALGNEYLKKDRLTLEDILEGTVRISFEKTQG